MNKAGARTRRTTERPRSVRCFMSLKLDGTLASVKPSVQGECSALGRRSVCEQAGTHAQQPPWQDECVKALAGNPEEPKISHQSSSNPSNQHQHASFHSSIAVPLNKRLAIRSEILSTVPC